MTQQLTELDALAAAAFNDRRRSEPRVLCERSIAIQPCADGDGVHFVKAQLTDCSMHGLGMMLSHPLQAGQQLLVKLEIDHQPTLMMYTLRYCIPTKSDQYRAGARFTGFTASRFRGELPAVVAALTGSTTVR